MELPALRLFVSRTSMHTKNRNPLNKDSGFLFTCVRGFEPPTFWSVAKRSIQLS